MTDKEIIIDEIDVSKCKYYSIKEYISNNNGYTEYPDYCSCYADGHCFKHNNCYYKQLKRKERECEELRKQLEKKKKIKRSECPYGGIDCAWCGEDCE